MLVKSTSGVPLKYCHCLHQVVQKMSSFYQFNELLLVNVFLSSNTCSNTLALLCDDIKIEFVASAFFDIFYIFLFLKFGFRLDFSIEILFVESTTVIFCQVKKRLKMCFINETFKIDPITGILS